MQKIFVKKADGSKEEFDNRKIIRTCMRAGLSKQAAENILHKVQTRLYDGISTRNIYDMVLKELERTEDMSSMLFRLREAVSEVPSEKFELYAKKILESCGFQCQWNVLIKGKCVEHQVDIVAEKAGMKYLVECKHHVNPHRFCGLGTVLQVQARLEDVRDGFRERKNNINFSHAWVMTNTKFSEHAKMYADGKKVLLSGWKYKGRTSLEYMIQNRRLYPISIIGAGKEVTKRLMGMNILTVQDAMSAEMIGVGKKTSDYVKRQCKLLT